MEKDGKGMKQIRLNSVGEPLERQEGREIDPVNRYSGHGWREI